MGNFVNVNYSQGTRGIFLTKNMLFQYDKIQNIIKEEAASANVYTQIPCDEMLILHPSRK